ncbi:MAG: ribonuclease P protein component [Acidobacteriota bacterium]|nr:ribonuclease P protein component [Acidobacteriota bacterium]
METIKSKRDFGRVFSDGKRVNHKLVRMTALRRDEGGPARVAFVASKRLGNAVFRNRCKRVLRAAAREAGLPRDGYDVILFATKATHDSQSSEVARSLSSLMSRFDS